jgi:hypothetical protein
VVTRGSKSSVTRSVVKAWRVSDLAFEALRHHLA